MSERPEPLFEPVPESALHDVRIEGTRPLVSPALLAGALLALVGGLIGVFVIVFWVLSVLLMEWSTFAYSLGVACGWNGSSCQTFVPTGDGTRPKNPITLFTVVFAIVACVLIFIWTRKRHGWKIALLSGIAGAGAGPVMFEFPFDWIIMWNLAVPAPVLVYRWLYFIPLFMFIFATLALCTLTPAARLRKQTLFALAAMFLIWTGWALTGFGYPAGIVPTAFNVVSKLAAAVAGLMIFLPDWKAEKAEAAVRAAEVKPLLEPEVAARIFDTN